MTAVELDPDVGVADDDEDALTDTPCKPFIRWVGSKVQLLPALRACLPKRITHYAEPFIGGGALFFAIQPRHAVLSDMNLRLVRTYRAIQADVEGVIATLKTYATAFESCAAAGTAEGLYYHLRDTINPDAMSDVELAAWFICLNKTNYNGLYRVNAAGKFNVPYGHRKNPLICDEVTLRSCSAALQRAVIVHRDFRETNIPAGGICYMDSPYWPLTGTADFTSYTAEGFSWKDQTDLRDLAVRLKQRGVQVLLSNSDTPATRELYKDFEVLTVSARRNIAASTSSRASVNELLIR